VGNLEPGNLAFGPAIGSEVPAHAADVRDGQASERAVAGDLTTEWVPGRSSGVVRVTPPAKYQGLDSPV
jgi:hypothetical protein